MHAAPTRGIPRTRPSPGLTLIELVVVIAIIGVIAAIAVPMYQSYVFDSQVASATSDIKLLETRIERFYSENRRYPDDLAEMGYGAKQDPWSQPYEYLNIQAGGPGVAGRRRKDRNLVPINSDFDLYSRGPDGDTRPPLIAPPSRDDIVRAANGAWIGLGGKY